MLLTLSGRRFIKIQCGFSPLFPVAYPSSIATQYYVKREKCKVNDVVFPSGCEARAINLGNKNMKTGIFTSVTSVRSKNIFTDISRYPTGKHEIKLCCLQFRNFCGLIQRMIWLVSTGPGLRGCRFDPLALFLIKSCQLLTF